MTPTSRSPGTAWTSSTPPTPTATTRPRARAPPRSPPQSAGIALLIQTLAQLTGLHIDHYVQINLLGFYRISNAIGGVPVVLCTAQKEANSGINLPAGLSVIQGTQALAFVRQRYDVAAAGDLDRIKRQQYFLQSVFHKLTSAGTLLNPFSVQQACSTR